jgi:hypothetical protein
MIIWSVSDDASRSWAGVGFIVAPSCKCLVRGFLQFSDRLASIKLKVSGGKIAFVTGYAPHNLRPFDEKHVFYIQLGQVLDQTSVNGSKYLMGDFNARVGHCRAGEELEFGPCGFGREATHQVEAPNRDLLFDCTSFGYLVGSMLVDNSPIQKASFMEADCRLMDDINFGGFAMLGLVLMPSGSEQELLSAVSVREAALASDHFMLYCVLHCEIE